MFISGDSDPDVDTCSVPYKKPLTDGKYVNRIIVGVDLNIINNKMFHTCFIKTLVEAFLRFLKEMSKVLISY